MMLENGIIWGSTGDAGNRWGIAHLQTVWAHLCVKWKSLTANSFEDSVAELKAYAREQLESVIASGYSNRAYALAA